MLSEEVVISRRYWFVNKCSCYNSNSNEDWCGSYMPV